MRNCGGEDFKNIQFDNNFDNCFGDGRLSFLPKYNYRDYHTCPPKTPLCSDQPNLVLLRWLLIP
jgi:hypothetical protein